MGKQRVTVLSCDNPECPNKAQIHSKDDPALGYHIGKGMWHGGGGGGPIPAFFADTLDCIRPAIEHVIHEAWNK